jgi:hypothetical protein
MSKVCQATEALNLETGRGFPEGVISPDFEQAENKHDPRNHTKPHEIETSIRVTSCGLVDRFTALERNNPTSNGNRWIADPWTLDLGRWTLDAYLSRAPLGTSSVKVASTGFPSSPTEAARSMP